MLACKNPQLFHLSAWLSANGYILDITHLPKQPIYSTLKGVHSMEAIARGRQSKFLSTAENRRWTDPNNWKLLWITLPMLVSLQGSYCTVARKGVQDNTSAREQLWLQCVDLPRTAVLQCWQDVTHRASYSFTCQNHSALLFIIMKLCK